MWSVYSNNIQLEYNIVHIWYANLNIEESLELYFYNILSSDEKQKANRFRFPKDRTHYIAGRGILRELLGKILSKNPNIIQFMYSKYDKPFLKDNSDLQFNISHSNGIGLFGFVKEYLIGVDIEYAKRPIEVEQIASRFFSKNEAKRLLDLPGNQQLEGFYNCWTRKEAIIKAIGQGLSFPLDQFEVSLKLNEEAKLLATYWDRNEVENWQMKSFSPIHDYKGALAVRGKINTIKYWKWSHGLSF